MNPGGNQGYGRGPMQPLSGSQQAVMQQQGGLPHAQQPQQPIWSQRAPPISSVANQQRLTTNMMPGNRSMMPVMMSGQQAFSVQQQQHAEMQPDMHIQNQQQQHQQHMLQQQQHNTVMMRTGLSGQQHVGGSQRMNTNMPSTHLMQQQQYQQQQQQMMAMQAQEMQQPGIQQPPPVYSSQPPPTDMPSQMMQHAGIPPNALHMQRGVQPQRPSMSRKPQTVEEYRLCFYQKVDSSMKKHQITSIGGRSLNDYEAELWRKFVPDSNANEECLRGYASEMRNLEHTITQNHQQQLLRTNQSAMHQQQMEQEQQQLHGGGRFVGNSGMPPGAMQGSMPPQQPGGPPQQQQPGGGANPIDALQKMTGGDGPRPSFEMQQQPPPMPSDMQQPPSGVRVLMSPPQPQQPPAQRFMPTPQFQPQQQSQLHALVSGQQPPIRSSMPGGPLYSTAAPGGGPPPPQHLIAQPPNVQLQQQQRLQLMQQQQAGGMRGYVQRTMLSGGGGSVMVNPQQQNSMVGLAPQQQFRAGPAPPMMMMGGSPAASVMSPAPTPPTQQQQRPSLLSGGPSSQPPPTTGNDEETNYRIKLKELADRYLGMVQSQSMSKAGGAGAGDSGAKLHQLYLILSGEKKVDYNVLLKCERVLESFHERVQSSQQQQQQQQQPTTSASLSAANVFVGKQSPAPTSSFDAVKTEPIAAAAESVPILSSSRAIKQEFMPPSTTVSVAQPPSAATAAMSTSAAPTTNAPSPPGVAATSSSPPAMYFTQNVRQPRIEVKRGEIGTKIMETLMNATNSIVAKRRQSTLMSNPMLAGDDFATWMGNTDEERMSVDVGTTDSTTKNAASDDSNKQPKPQRRRRKPVAYQQGDDFYSMEDTDDDDVAIGMGDAELADLSDDVLSKLGLCLTYDEFEIKAPPIPLNF